MNKKNNGSILPAVLVALVVLAVVLLVYMLFKYMFPGLAEMLLRGDEEAVEAYLDAQGEWKGLVSIYFICILQVVSIVIPGMVIHVAAGVIYGWWKAFLVCYFGFVSGQAFVFYTVRALHRRVSAFVESLSAVEHLKDRVNASDPAFAAAVACMIPGIPNGFIPYAFSSLEIRLIHFTTAIASACWIQILCNCAIGHFLIRGEFIYMVISFLFQFFMIFLAVRYKHVVKRMIRG